MTISSSLRAACFLLALSPLVKADEGMWLFNEPPKKLLMDKYHFDATPAWLEHVQKASVRFNDGGSGSFVSPNGLVMTNHHVGTDCIQKLGTKEHDYIKTGFSALSQAQEPKCADLELNVLMSIEDVTARVNEGITPDMDGSASEQKQRANINAIEKESLDKTGLRSNVIMLYNGGAYHLYRYKKYTDVRLVFAPEKEAAFFGGDPDNFEFPRYDLDICFFRVYENGTPIKVEHYLKWSREGAKQGDLIFVSGNPGSTARLDTVQHLEFLRDRGNPFIMDLLRRREVMLRVYSDRDRENLRRAQDELFGVENSRKAYLGMQAGLQDPAIMDLKKRQEQELRDAVKRDPKLQADYGGAWDAVGKTVQSADEIYTDWYMLERGAAFHSKLFGIARTIVRLAQESIKPNGERLREYSDAGLESMKLRLFSDAPIYEDLETVELADSLGMMAEVMGGDNDLVKLVLANKSPRDRAAELIHGTALKDVAVRKRLADGGLKAVDDSTDPMIQLARQIDPEARRIRKVYEQQVAEPQQQAYTKIANARFAVYGSSVYPDAMFTLRLAFGEVKGYTQAGEIIPWGTTLGGTYKHAAEHDNKYPFELPKIWNERKSQLKLSTPFNFVSTADIIGGNSGSPVINRQGELVGIIFDGNIQSLVLDYIYTDQEARAVAVHSAGILEALRKVYQANRLVTELTGKK